MLPIGSVARARRPTSARPQIRDAIPRTCGRGSPAQIGTQLSCCESQPLEQVETTAKPYGGKWLAKGGVQVVARSLARLSRSDGIPEPHGRAELVQLARVPTNPAPSRQQRDQ